MSAPKTFNVEFTEAEMHGLIECLTNLRSNYISEMGFSEARGHPIYAEAGKLQEKLSNVVTGDSDTSWAIVSPPPG